MRNLLPLFLVLFLLVYLPFLSAQDFSLNAVSSTYHSQISPNNTSLYQGGIQVYGNVSLSWDSVSGASCYNIYYKGWVGYYQGQPSATELFESTCNYTLNRARTIYYRDSFTPDSTYFFKVKAVDSNNNEFAESNIVRVNFQDWCSDSDGGKVYDEWGYAKTDYGNPNSTIDHCTKNFTSTTEFFCAYNHSSASGKKYYVANETVQCPQGYFCDTGACVNLKDRGCIDTDGWAKDTKGFRITFNETTSQPNAKQWDYCITGPVTQFPERDIIDDPSKKVDKCKGNDCYVIEYQCNSLKPKVTFVPLDCFQGCSDGACFQFTPENNNKKNLIEAFFEALHNWLKKVFGTA